MGRQHIQFNFNIKPFLPTHVLQGIYSQSDFGDKPRKVIVL